MTETDEEHRALVRHWRTLMGDSPAAVALRDDLLRRYGEPRRHYHTRAHLRAVVTAVDTLAGHCRDATAVRLAAWFHDAVYEGQAGADEEASARLAEESLAEQGVEPDRVAQVARLVRLTATHTPEAADVDGQVLCDADLAILGAEPAEYAAYSRGIRAEYAHVPAPRFTQGRVRILTQLSRRTALFHTPLARRWWEDSARRNIANELAHLADLPGGADTAGSGPAAPEAGFGESGHQFPAG